MKQKPLPDGFNAYAFNAADMMFVINRDTGIPLRELIDLTPQQIYDFVATFLDPEDDTDLATLVIITDDVGEDLKQLMRTTLARLRPELRDVPHNEGITSRSLASATPGEAVSDESLQDLEARRLAEHGCTLVVIEDDDFHAYGVEMNRIISGRPHGRSAALD